MILIAALTCVALIFGSISWRVLRHGQVGPRVWSVGAAVFVWCVGLGVMLAEGVRSVDAQSESPAASWVQSLPLESIAWPGNDSTGMPGKRSSAMRPVAAAASAAPIDAAPIVSLIGGLEARLVAEPGDAKGWALLAQSYAFIGKSEAAEQAMGRAVELGMDEQTLRDRIAAAAGHVRHANWIQQAIGG